MSTPRLITEPIKLNSEFLKNRVDVGIEVTGPTDPALLGLFALNQTFPAGVEIELGKMSARIAGGLDRIEFLAGQSIVAFKASAEAHTGLGVYSDPRRLLKALKFNTDLEETIENGLALNAEGNDLFVMLQWGYDLAASATGTLALGTLGAAKFTAKGDRAGVYAVIRRMNREETGAKTAVEKTIGSWKLPRHVNSVTDLEPGTWLIAEVDGSIAFNLSAQLGYDFDWVRELKSGGLTGDIGLKVQLGLKTALGMFASSKYALVLSREEAERLRLRCFKLSMRGHEFTLNAGATVTGRAELPPKFDDLLKAVFGMHGAQVVRDLQALEQWTDPQQKLPGVLARLSSGYGKKLLADVTGTPLAEIETRFDEARQQLTNALTAWRGLDERAHDAATLLWKLIEEKEPAELQALRNLTKAIAGADEDGLRNLLGERLEKIDFFESPEGRWLQSILTGGILSALNSGGEFARLREAAQRTSRVLDGSTVEGIVRNLQKNVEERLHIEQIEDAIKSKDLKAIDEWLTSKLEDFLEKQVDLKELERLRETINHLVVMRQKIYDAAVKALNRQYEFALDAAFKRSTTETAMLDVEFDFSRPELADSVRESLASALNGQFDDLLVQAKDGVILHKGMLSHEINRQSHVEVSLPFYNSRVDHVNTALARVSAVEDDGRVLLYDLNAEDTVTVKNKLVSSLGLRGQVETQLSGAVREHSPSSFVYSYSFRQAIDKMRTADLRNQLEPYQKTYLANAFRNGSVDARRPTFDSWLRHLDATVEEIERNGPDLFGRSLLSLDVSLPAEFVEAWFLAPRDEKDEAYFRMSLRLQGALKRFIPFYYFQDARHYGNLDSAAALMVYAEIPPAPSIKIKDNKLVHTNKRVVWDLMNEDERNAMISSEETKDNLVRELQRIHPMLVALDHDQKEFYRPDQLSYNRLIAAVTGSLMPAKPGRTLLNSLLSVERSVIKGAIEAGVKLAKFKEAQNKEPSKAIEALAHFGEKLTSAFNEKIKDFLFGGAALLPLGSAMFAEATLALNPSLESKALAMLELTVLKGTSKYTRDKFLRKEQPKGDDIVIMERVTSLNV